ncbi:MAG TPA: methyltransferase [Gammaproteobacteria bacterium]|jgi:predicted methyltransferase|nr:methyltransferase [Gammaproteobacteria bacterium]
MSFIRNFGATLTLVFIATACADTTEELKAAAAGEHRSAANQARNVWRHPVETLQFFGIRDDMTVVEIWPGGGGWYTEVLAPYLRDEGKLYAANYDGSSGIPYFRRNEQKFKDKLAAMPDVYDRVVVTALMPPASMEPAPAGSADMVVTFRNLHNWVGNGTEGAMLKAMYDVLKPGGILGLTDHRGNPDMFGVEWAATGYVAEADAIRVVEAAGFKFVARSEINANPKDTKDYPQGVWTLPPTYRLGNIDKAKYQAIGESDRMTLKFVKAP